MTAVQRTSHKREDPFGTPALGHHQISNVNPSFLVEKVPLLADLHASFTQTGMTNGGWARSPQDSEQSSFHSERTNTPWLPCKGFAGGLKGSPQLTVEEN